MMKHLLTLCLMFASLSYFAQDVDITFELNMASVPTDAGGQVYIAGGGNFGNPGDNLMTETSPGSDIYTITFTQAQGFSSFYTFTNGLCPGYECKENLTGLPCGDPGNFNDRFLPPVQTDTTLLICFGQCTTDGSCDVIETSDVTFSVDMNEYPGNFTTVSVGGTWNGFNPTEFPMTETAPGSGIYETTLNFTEGSVQEFKFIEDGGIAGEENYEQLAEGSSCTVTNFGFTNRVFTVGEDDETFSTVCFSSCESCENALPFYDVTFRVDMTQQAGTFTNVGVFGSFNGFCAACTPAFTDDNGDNIYEGTVSIQEGTIEYLYILEAGAGGQESFVEGDPCTSTIDGFTNRTLDVTSDIVVEAFCYNTCEACPSTGPVNDAFCEALSIAVNDTITANSTDATDDGPEGPCWTGTPGDVDIWFSFVAPASGEATVETINTGDNDDTQVAVYSSSDGTCAGDTMTVGCSEDISGTDFMSLVELTGLNAGDTYFIQVDGWQGTSGEFDITVRAEEAPGFCDGSTAIICDDIDTYTLGSIDGQAAHWAPWTPGSTDVAEVVDNISFSGSQSLRVGPGGTEDNLLLLGDQDMGVWTVDWKMYVPADSTAFFNIQADPTPGQAFIFQAFCNEDGGAPGVGTFQGLAETFTYPEDAWFDVSILVDMNNLVHSLSIDGVLVLDELPYVSNAGPADATTLSSINFYSIDAENTYYLDNVVFDGNPNVGVSEYVQDLYTVFPNPTEGMVTVQGEQNIEGIVVRDMLGAVVLKVASPYANRVELDMSSLENGVYFLEVQVDSQININRVVKN